MTSRGEGKAEACFICYNNFSVIGRMLFVFKKQTVLYNKRKRGDEGEFSKKESFKAIKFSQEDRV
jgi:hypothetical protein